MPINKPTHDQLIEWEALLEAEGLGSPEKDLNFVSLRDTDGVRIPAQPVREGGLFWRERAAINWGAEHRSRGSAKRSPIRFNCPVCGKGFDSRKGSQFCSTKCRMRSHRRYAKLRTLSEETKQ